MKRDAAKNSPIRGRKAASFVSSVVGDEDSNSLSILLSVLNGRGSIVGERVSLPFYLSDAADGGGLTATSPTAIVLAPGTGVIVPAADYKTGRIIVLPDTVMNFTIAYTGAKTWYVVFILPDGSLHVTDAAVFT